MVGAHALAAHDHARAAKDMDVWDRPSPEKARRVIAALEAFGAPLQGVKVEELSLPDLVDQLGVAAVRMDAITSIAGVVFGEAYSARLETHFAGEPVGVLSCKLLIQNKSATARPRDLADEKLLRGEADES